LRYFIDPFGCAKNQVLAENMMACLDKAGWLCAKEADDADLIIVNSCGFIESAKQESINAVLQWRALYSGKKILLAGCLAQRYAKELSEALPEADGFFGVDGIGDIAQVAARLAGAEIAGGVHGEVPPPGARPLLSLPGSAYVKIADGCSNRCSYCAIPLIWGDTRSRDIDGIIDECRLLLRRGVKELCIVGQDICSFGMDAAAAGGDGRGSRLPDLLRCISRLEGHFWVRLLYLHPDRFPLEILDIMAADSRFLPYFDIPFQHASPKILAAMKRGGSAEKYLGLIETIRGRLPKAVIRSTFLLGFPGETDSDFAQLLDFQQKAALDWLGCFAYSREEGTESYSMKGQVPKKTALLRKKQIEERQVPITEKNMERFAGQHLDVLLEEQVDDFWLGRVYCQAPDIDGSAVIAIDKTAPELAAGDLVPCKIIARRGFDLEAAVLKPGLPEV